MLITLNIELEGLEKNVNRFFKLSIHHVSFCLFCVVLCQFSALGVEFRTLCCASSVLSLGSIVKPQEYFRMERNYSKYLILNLNYSGKEIKA